MGDYALDVGTWKWDASLMDDDLAREDLAGVEAKLAAKGAVVRPCPVCETTEWFLNLGERVVLTGVEPGGTFRMDCVILACSNCGFVRMHNVDLLFED